MSDALRRALEYVDESRAAAAQQPANLREAADAQDMWAPTRAYEAGRLATDINANNADIARLRANNRAQEADVLERQNQALAQRQALYAPDIEKVEDIGSKNGYLRDGLSWFGSQLGNAAASAQDPVALAAAGTAVGRAASVVPQLRGVGKAIQYGSQLGAFGLNQRQMTGEMYGRLKDDPVAFANMTPQEAYRTSNLYGVGAGALESLLPGTLGHALGGGALRVGGRAALQHGAGATLLKDAATEGGTELAEQYAQQQVHSAYNPQRVTSGDFSENLNAALGGAAGGAGLGAPHAIADAAYGRAARTGEVVREKAGETVDLLKEKAPQVYEDSGVKGVVDLGAEKARGAYEGVAGAFKKATDYLRDEQGRINYPEATRKAMADYDRYKMSQEEADILTAVPPEGLDPEGTKAWAQENDARRGELIANRLAALEADGVQEASPLLDAVTGDDPVAQFEALNQATEFLLQRNAAAQVNRKAAVLREFTGTKIQQAAHAVTRAAQKAAGAAVFTGMNVAEGVAQATGGPKRNAQGTQGESAPMTYDQWMAARAAVGRAFDAHGAKLRAQKRAATPAPAPEQVQAATTAGELFARAAAREDLGGDVRAREDYGRSLAYELSEMAQEYELRGFVRPSVFDALADDLRDALGKDAQDAVMRMAALEGGSQLLTDMAAKVSNATLRARRPTQLQDQLIAQLPQEHQAEIRKSGAADLQEAVLDIARGRMSERRIKEIEKAIGGDTLRRMLEIVDGPDETFSARAQNEAPIFGQQGQAEEFDPDRLTMNDDGEVGDFEKRQAERRVKRGAAPRMYVFPKDPVAGMRTTDSENRRTARNPFEPTSKLSPAEAAKAREAAAAAQLMGEDAKPVIARTRPRMSRRDDVNSDGKNTLAHKIAQLEETLGVARTPEAFFRRAEQELRATKGAERAKASEQFKRLQQLEKQFASGDERAVARVGEMMERFFDVRAGGYVVDARSAREVMDEQNMPEAQRMAIFRDYMLQEGARVREKDAGKAEKYFQLARNAQAALLDGVDGTDTKPRAQRVYRLTAGDRATLRRAMERYFGENYLVVGEQLSDRVPGTMAVGELIEMAKSGAKARDAVRGQVSAAAGERGGKDAATDMRGEAEGHLLNFPQRAGGNLLGSRGNKGDPLVIKTHSLVAWVRNNRRETPDEKLSEEKAFLRDLQEGIAAVTNMESVGGLPFMLDKFGRKQYFDGRNVPDALQLPNRTGWAFNQKRREGALAEDQWKDAGIMGPRDPSTVEDARSDEKYQKKLANEYAPGEDLAQGGANVAPPIVGDASNVGYLDPYSDIARRAGMVTRRKKPMQTLRQKRLAEHAVRVAAAKRGKANTKAPDDHAAASLRNTRIDKGKLDWELFNETGLESDKIRDSEHTTVEKEEVASRSKDVTAGIGRESAVDAVSKAADRGDRVFAYKGERREVVQGGRLVRVDQDLDVATTLENIDRRLRAVNDTREKFAKGRHYAYPLAYALSVKNVQELLDSGALSTEESEAFIDRQRQAAQVITTAPAGARLRLAKAMASGYRAVRNYEEADAFLASLGRDAAPEVAAAGAPKSQRAPGGAKLTGKTPFTPKDQAKADRATKFIGRGSERSSTAQYAKDFGALANTGSYTASDTVFVSAEGARAGRVEPDFAEIDRAVAAGATVVTDNAENRAREYNMGERQVAAHLAKKGYTETSPGTWTAPKTVGTPDNPAVAPPPTKVSQAEARKFIGGLDAALREPPDAIKPVLARVVAASAEGNLAVKDLAKLVRWAAKSPSQAAVADHVANELLQLTDGTLAVGGLAQKTVDSWSKKFAGGAKIEVLKIPKGHAYELLMGHMHDVDSLGGAYINVDGKHVIASFESGAKTRVTALSRLAHEFGHALQRIAFDSAPERTQQKIRAAYEADLTALGKDDGELRRFISSARVSDDVLSAVDGVSPDALQAAAPMIARGVNAGVWSSAKGTAQGEYLTSFPEWFAENFSKYATTSADLKLDPEVRGFWEGLLKKLRGFFNHFVKQYTPDATFAGWVDSLAANAPKRKLSLMSTQIHNDLRRPGFSATHDSPIRHEGRFNWREHTGKGEGAAAFGAGTYLSTGDGVHKFYKKMMSAKAGETSPTYHVSVQAMKAQLLNWDKPLGEQSSYVQKRIYQLFEDKALGNPEDLHRGRATGAQLYKEITDQLGSQREASNALQATGILGHEYAAANGRDGKTPNYVIYDDSKISTNYVSFNKQGAGKFEGWKTGPTARQGSGVAPDADVAAARAYVDKVLGPQVKAEFESITGYSGEWIEAENLIKVSTLTNAGVMNVARHEALHAFYSRFVKANPKAQRVLASLTDDPRVLRRLEALLKDEPEALGQLTDGEERLAYIHQFAQAGLLKLPHTPGTTLMAKVRKFLRRVFQMVSDQERAVDLLYSFERGDFRGLEPSAAGRVIAKSIDQGAWLKNGTKAFDKVMQAAAALTVPAHTILQNSASPTARKIAELFYTNPADEAAGDKEPGYLNERNQQMRRYSNLFRNAVGELDEGQRRELLEAMQNETSTASLRDPDVQDAKEKLHAMFSRFHRYLTDEKGLRIGKINENYFPVVYDAEKVRDGSFAKMLREKYASNIAEMVERINAAREKGGKAGVPVSADDVIEAVVQRIAGENPMDDTTLDPLREDGVLRPWFAGGEKRTLNFLEPEDRAPFLEKDLVRTLSQYVRQGVRAAEYSSRFGRQGALLSKQLEAVGQELQDAADKMLKEGDLKDEKARDKWVSRQYRDVANAVGAMEGSLGHDVPEWVRKTNSAAIVYQNVRILPLALFSSFVDPLGIIARGGEMRDAFNTFARGMRDVARTWGDMLREEPKQRQKDEWEKLAEHVGVIDAAVFNHFLHDEYASVYLDGRAKKINEVMFKANGMEPFNRAMRVGATQSAVKFIERHSKKPEAHSARWMAELGFDKASPHFDVDGRLITDKNVLMEQNPGMSQEQAEAEIARTHRAINRWVEGAILSPNAAQRPAWASDPHYSMFWHLKQFAYSFHQTIMKRAVSEAKHGNVLPLGVFAWYIPTMIAADVAKGMMLGAGELPNYMKGYDLGDWVVHGVNRAGVLGVGDIGVNAAREPLGLAGPMVEQISDIFTEPLEKNITHALPANALYSRALS